MKRAIIVGCAGQDGTILWNQLVTRGFSLVGLGRQSVRAENSSWTDPVSLGDAAAVQRLVDAIRPDQIYYLAAHHHSSQDDVSSESAIWTESWRAHVEGFRHFLDAVRTSHTATRIFYASSSRIFGDASTSPQNETTPIRPVCLYGITKASGMMLADYYRRRHGLHVACGILFNHESPLRRRQFLSQRVVHGIVALKAGRMSRMEIGRLDAQVDWGYAPDYTRAMQLMVEAGAPRDYVVATGELHSVREMIQIAADIVGLEWQSRVVENAAILRRPPLPLCGDAARLRADTGWAPSIDFRGLVETMTRAAMVASERIS